MHSSTLLLCPQDVLTTALETSGCGTFVFEAEAASVAEKWAKLAAFRALLLDGKALVELGGRQVPSYFCWSPGQPRCPCVSCSAGTTATDTLNPYHSQ